MSLTPGSTMMIMELILEVIERPPGSTDIWNVWGLLDTPAPFSLGYHFIVRASKVLHIVVPTLKPIFSRPRAARVATGNKDGFLFEFFSMD